MRQIDDGNLTLGDERLRRLLREGEFAAQHLGEVQVSVVRASVRWR